MFSNAATSPHKYPNPFCYNCKTGNVMIYDRHVLHWEKLDNELTFYYRKRGIKIRLAPLELEDLRSALQWFMSRNISFDRDVEKFAKGESK